MEEFLLTPIHWEGQAFCGRSEKVKELFELSKVIGAPFQEKVLHWRDTTICIIQTERRKVIGEKENQSPEKSGVRGEAKETYLRKYETNIFHHCMVPTAKGASDPQKPYTPSWKFRNANLILKWLNQMDHVWMSYKVIIRKRKRRCKQNPYNKVCQKDIPTKGLNWILIFQIELKEIKKMIKT